MQKEIVTEIEGYQKVISGARAILDNYRPHIPIHPDWPMVKLGDLATFIQGTRVPVEEQRTDFIDGYVRFIRIIDYTQESNDIRYIKNRKGIEGVFANNLFRIDYYSYKALGDFLFYFFKSIRFQLFVKNNVMQAAMPALSHSIMKEMLIPLPPLATQQAIVAEIEADQTLVAANRELIARFEKKVQATLARIWGEDESVMAEVNGRCADGFEADGSAIVGELKL